MSQVKPSSSTAGSRWSELVIQAHRGPYRVEFREDAAGELKTLAPRSHYLVDASVARLHAAALKAVLAGPSTVVIEALEPSKSLEALPLYVDALLRGGVRRGDVLIAVGGGIIQDITCFLAATLLRGVDWEFFPTTLLAQADSCVGSKSSINSGGAKNILGTFTPPRRVVIAAAFLKTLNERELRSGVGEMLKCHVIAGPEAFDRIAADYPKIFTDEAVMLDYIRRSLEIKRPLVETDEFDRGPRLVMNYGHSFGHAIEGATEYAVPHGIAVTLGMDMANFIATRLGRLPEAHRLRMRPTLAANFKGFEATSVPFDGFMAALGKDKKNTAAKLRLILPGADARPEITEVVNDEPFRTLCKEYLETGRR